eukprot:GFUD01047510.1.p1 GENE.GFUD01047510.1~~GFUD01047510.1.p1  ORF type:complete len:163 (+),score=19.63 GFUD01047510.1:41-529(+)
MSIVDQMATLHIRGKHNNTTYDFKFPEEATIQDLGEKVHELTGVPISGQKLICCGKQLPKDLKVTLKEAGFKTGIGSKLMILGKKYDPENEDDYKQIVELENKSKNIEHKVDEVATEVAIEFNLKVDIYFSLLDRWYLQGPSRQESPCRSMQIFAEKSKEYK